MGDKYIVEVSEQGVRLTVLGPQGGNRGGVLMTEQATEALLTKLSRGLMAHRILVGKEQWPQLPAGMRTEIQETVGSEEVGGDDAGSE